MSSATVLEMKFISCFTSRRIRTFAYFTLEASATYDVQYFLLSLFAHNALIEPPRMAAEAFCIVEPNGLAIEVIIPADTVDPNW